MLKKKYFEEKRRIKNLEEKNGTQKESKKTILKTINLKEENLENILRRRFVFARFKLFEEQIVVLLFDF